MNTHNANQAQSADDVEGHTIKGHVVPPSESDVEGHAIKTHVTPPVDAEADDVDGHTIRGKPLAPSAEDDVDAHCLAPQTRLTDDYVRPGRPGPHSQRSAADTEDDVQGHVGFDDDEAHLKR